VRSGLTFKRIHKIYEAVTSAISERSEFSQILGMKRLMGEFISTFLLCSSSIFAKEKKKDIAKSNMSTEH
jgi:hypothetical protein